LKGHSILSQFPHPDSLLLSLSHSLYNSSFFVLAWCRACRAVESSYRNLPKEFPSVKFVEVPLTKDNSYLHEGLGVKSLPFAHIYDPNGGLVEERKVNKHVFSDFKRTLRTYVNGECDVAYDENGESNHHTDEVVL
jgi:hypothetical protein